MSGFSMINRTRASIPRASFRALKEHVLGPDYDLNIAFIPATEIRKLNKIYRGLDRPTDILSFPLGKNGGEIYICPAETKIEAKKFERTYDNFLKFLFIHGLVHLKGHDHGATMERIEARVRGKFNV